MYKSPLFIVMVVALLAVLAVGLGAWQFVSIKSTGTPLGAAVRSPTHLLQLISTTERYLPKLHRAPGSDRFRIDLLAISMTDPTKQQTFTLLRQQQANALTPITKILGVDGDVVWVQALEIFAVNLKTKRIVREADLRKANPELEVFLASAKPDFTDRFVAVSPEWSHAYAFPAETFKATPVLPPSRGSWADTQLNGRIENSLCSGGLISSNDWIAVATLADAKSCLKPGFSLPRDFTTDEKNRPRQLYRGRAVTSETRPRIETSERMSATEYRAATFLRAKPGGTILRAQNPDGIFLLYRTGTELFVPHTLTRLAPDGKALWNTDTGIGRLTQVLLGENSIALIGERLPIPNKVSEPILVIINAGTGATNIVSLWR